MEPSSSAAGQVRVLATPTVVGDVVVLSVIEEGTFNGPAVVGYDKYVGTERWRGRDGIGASWSNVYNSASVAGGDVVFASSLSEGIQAVDGASGAAVWTAGSATLCDRQWASTVVVGDVVVVPRTDGSLYGFDVASASVLWELPLTEGEDQTSLAECTLGDLEIAFAQLQASPAIAPDGTIVVGSLGGVLYAVGQSGGE